MKEQLIVIGNGFDLTAGLNSTYLAFFERYFSGRKEDFTIDPKNEEVNFWKELFWERKKRAKSHQDLYWSDVESIIEKKLLEIESSFSAGRLMAINVDDATSIVVGDKVKYLKKKIQKEVVTKYELIKALYTDLKDFEFEFVNFLETEVSRNKEYPDNSNQLMSELLVRNFVQRESFANLDNYYNRRNKFIKDEEVKTQILSFNYTHGINVETFVRAEVFNNVHGNIDDKNIIFGIDGHGILNKYLLLPFTKTYRIMMNKMKRFKLDGDLQYIKFFGHGLAEADYSYFQTIFDDVDLYNGNTELIFYFNVYDESRRKEIIEKQHLRIVKLIQKYGETLDNKDHGKNMMHKLLLEGRIQVAELPIEKILLSE